jgi:FkbM family methyltransferase
MRRIIKAFTPPILWSLGRKIKNGLIIKKEASQEDGISTTNHGIFYYENEGAFKFLYNDYFIKEKYKFESTNQKPLIIDGGANIGVGCRYWKFLYPESEVIAFEPDELNFSLLNKNMINIPGFRAEKKALWSTNGALKFHAVGGESGYVAKANAEIGNPEFVVVPAFRLRDLLNRKIDLLKLDIEGGEMEVLRDCKDYLHNVERIFVEHHSFLESPQQLSDFFGVLENAGFRINVQVDIPAKQPFLKRYIYNKKYSWINVFGFRN